jgi:3-hydroxypropanoate dehydrogenase
VHNALYTQKEARGVTRAEVATHEDLLVLAPDAQELLFRNAGTANSFSERPVTDDQLSAIWDLARWGPTSMNSQPLRVLVLRTGEGRERLIPHLAEGNRPKTSTAPVTLVFAAYPGFWRDLPRIFPHLPGLKDRFIDEPDRARTVARLNATLQVAYVLIAVRAAGLCAGPMSGFDAAGVDAEFFADRGWESLVVMNVGYPGADPWKGRLLRLDYDEVFARYDGSR